MDHPLDHFLNQAEIGRVESEFLIVDRVRLIAGFSEGPRTLFYFILRGEDMKKIIIITAIVLGMIFMGFYAMIGGGFYRHCAYKKSAWVLDFCEYCQW